MNAPAHGSLLHNPWVWAGVVGVVAVVVLLGKGGTTTASSGNSASVATLASSNAANVQLAGLSTQLQTSLATDQTAITLAGIKADTQNQITQSGLWASTIGAALTYAQNSDNNATSRSNVLAQIMGSITTHRDTIAATEQLAPQLAAIQATSLYNLANLQAGTQRLQSDNQIAISANQAAASVNLANAQGATAVQLAQITSGAQVQQQTIQAASQAASGIGSTIADLAPLALMLL